jgi:hypothetical protein
MEGGEAPDGREAAARLNQLSPTNCPRCPISHPPPCRRLHARHPRGATSLPPEALWEGHGGGCCGRCCRRWRCCRRLPCWRRTVACCEYLLARPTGPAPSCSPPFGPCSAFRVRILRGRQPVQRRYPSESLAFSLSPLFLPLTHPIPKSRHKLLDKKDM